MVNMCKLTCMEPWDDTGSIWEVATEKVRYYIFFFFHFLCAFKYHFLFLVLFIGGYISWWEPQVMYFIYKSETPHYTSWWLAGKKSITTPDFVLTQYHDSLIVTPYSISVVWHTIWRCVHHRPCIIQYENYANITPFSKPSALSREVG